jgi:hypothetical protein
MMVQVQTGKVNTFGGFFKAIRDMLDKVVSAQRKHEEINKKMMAQCKEEEDFRQKEIAAAKDALKRAIAARTRCKASYDNARAARPKLARAKVTYEAELARATKQRNIERAKYLRRKQEFTEALNFLADFMNYVFKSFRGKFKAYSLAELSENLLKHTSKLNLLVEAVPVLAEMTQVYKYADNQSLGQKLKDALNTLNNRIKTDKANDDKIETAAAAVFAKYSARLNRIIATLKKNIERLDKQIRDMDHCMDMEGKIIASASKKDNRNTTLRNNARNMCASFTKEFIEATYNRRDEITTMQQIIEIVSKRFKKLPKDLISYLEEVKDGWRKYINSTEFKKFIEYVRIQYVENKRGKLLASVDADNKKFRNI